LCTLKGLFLDESSSDVFSEEDDEPFLKLTEMLEDSSNIGFDCLEFDSIAAPCKKMLSKGKSTKGKSSKEQESNSQKTCQEKNFKKWQISNLYFCISYIASALINSATTCAGASCGRACLVVLFWPKASTQSIPDQIDRKTTILNLNLDIYIFKIVIWSFFVNLFRLSNHRRDRAIHAMRRMTQVPSKKMMEEFVSYGPRWIIFYGVKNAQNKYNRVN
jgi:hypothetical protein